jgi:DsbC/DsbD-like thiol-disulfide interchange protein
MLNGLVLAILGLMFTRMSSALVMAAACAALVVAPVTAQRSKPLAHARVTLLADGGASGAPLTFGVRFQLDEGWHIYWRNAGGSGSPPSIAWTPVPGLTTGDIQWPVPARIQTDAIVSYGYDGDVLLLVPAERSAAASRAVTLAAALDYAICRDICVKETATAALALPAAAAMPPRSPEAALFDRARAQIPRRAPADWTMTARLGVDTIALRVATQMPFRKATFFPFVNGLIDDAAAQRAEISAQGLTLQIPKSPYFSSAPAVLEGVLLIDGGSAFAVKAPFGVK